MTETANFEALRALYGDGIWEIEKSLRDQISEPPKKRLVRVAIENGPVIASRAKEGSKLVQEGSKQAASRAKDVSERVRDKVKKNDESEFVAEHLISKTDDEKRQVYGWVSVTEVDGKPVVDRQNDYVDIEEIEKAAHEYLTDSRNGGDMHKKLGVSRLIESFVVTPEKKKMLGLPDDTPTGWWAGFQVEDDDVWDMVKKGQRPAFSIHGRAQRVSKEM